MFIQLFFTTQAGGIDFELLFEKYRRLLLHKAYEILRDYGLAEDAVSEAFIRIYKNTDKLDRIDSSRTISFLVTIVKNTALTLLAKRKGESPFDDSIAAENDGFDLEGSVLSKAVTEDMLELVGGLKEELRAPFLLKYAHDLSHREIADLLKISENNVTVRIHRAKKKLAELFREAGYIYGDK